MLHKRRESASQLSLTEEDVTRLLHIPAPRARLEVLQRVSSLYHDESLANEERQIAEQIFRVLLKDTEVSVRATLAEALKDDSHIPHDIAFSLARDVEQVALPVLSASEVLTDEDLIALVHYHRKVTCHAAVARRKNVSSSVCDALIETGEDEVVDTLLHNDGASLGEQQCAKVLELFPFHDAVLSSLARRPHLPLTVAEKLVNHVSQTLGEELRSKYHLPEPTVEEVAERARETETLALLNGAQEPEIVKLAAQLREEGRLSSSMLFAGLAKGYLTFFESGMAQLAGIPLTNARALIHDRGELGFRALYEKVQLPRKFFEAVKITRTVVSEMYEFSPRIPGTREYADTLAAQMIERTRSRRVENLSYMLALTRRA
jgi:uncharacterized protein (DUF2336 family)